MTHALTHLDRILRGDATRPDRLRADGLADLPVVRLSLVLVALAMSYGVCTGVYAVTGAGNGDYRQVISSTLKVPTLFALTLLVTLPSLYVFNTLLGSRLTFVGICRLMVAAMGVTIAVLASIGPIVAFFGVTTSSYPFMLLLNVAVFAMSGLLGLGFLRQTLDRMALVDRPVPIAVDGPATPSVLGERPVPTAADDFVGSTRGIFTAWMLVFGLVGSQMAWILRPFIGAPHVAFTWFRATDSNFFQAVWNAIESLMK